MVSPESDRAASFRAAVVGVVLLFATPACLLDAFSIAPRANPGLATASADVVALAGPDLVVFEGQTVTLSGLGSRSLVGSPTLAWTQTAGPPAALSNPSSPTPSFTAPLSPARVVFSLRAAVDAEHDDDEVVVDVVRAGPLPRPLLQASPADGVGAVDEPVTVRFAWHGPGVPIVNPRCPLRQETVVAVEGDEVVVELRPARLPCAVVVDDGGLGEGDAPSRRANRIACVVWPTGTVEIPRTRAVGPAVVDPGSDVQVAVDEGTSVASIDGTPMVIEPTATGVRFVAPRQEGPLALVAERRRGTVSGGSVLLPVVVRAGLDNVPPWLTVAPDLTVQPGARFRLAASAVDPDGDTVTIVRRQVLGAAARRAGSDDEVWTAPATSGTLVFHVIADDGTVGSAPVAVRVDVDPTAENQPPLLVVPETLHVVPGERFLLDASSATDPDDGLIADYQIRQDPNDTFVLLPEPADTASVALTAPEAGHELHFLLSAYDGDGLGVTVRVTVIVARAGPYVDPGRGDDASGDGSVDAPFATVAAALPTAARHRFAALLLAVGRHGVFDGALPDGLGLVGGQTFNGTAYVTTDAPDAVTTLPLGASGLAVTGADLRRLRTEGGPVRAARAVRLVDVAIPADVTVAPGGRLTATASEIGGALTVHEASAVGIELVVRGGIVARNAEIELRSADVAGTPALAVDGGVVVVQGSTFRTTDADGPVVELIAATSSFAGAVRSAGGEDVVGVVVDGGAVDLVELDVVAAATASARGLVVTGAAAVAGRALVAVSGVDASGIEATVVELVSGTVVATGYDAIGIRGDHVVLGRLTIEATGTTATAVQAVSGVVTASILRATVPGSDAGADAGEDGGAGAGTDSPAEGSARADAVVAARIGNVILRHATLIAPVGVVAVGGTPRLRNSVVAAAAPVVGDGDVDLAAVGVVGAPAAAIVCPQCVFAPLAVLEPTGRLASDGTLGGPNPLVDVGAAADAVAVDIDGDAIPQGAGPDLGADERTVP
jgi:hypothetical protein